MTVSFPAVPTTTDQPWHEKYPAPQCSPTSITPSLLLNLISQRDTTNPSYVLVDVRRNDHEGGTIITSINLPAQSLHPSIPVLLELFAAAGVKYIICYCGASRGRGPRCAGWFADAIRENGYEGRMESCVLEGGIKGWIRSGKELIAYGQVAKGQSFLSRVIEYTPEYWEQFEECRVHAH